MRPHPWMLRTGPCALFPTCRILLGYPQSDKGENEIMDAATVAQLGSGEPTVMHGEADTVQAMKEGARGRRRRGFAPASRMWAATTVVMGPRSPVSSALPTGPSAPLASPSNSRTSTPAPHGRPSPRPSPSAPGATSGRPGSTLFRLPRPPHVALTVGAWRHADADDEAPTSCRRGRGTGLARPGLSDADRAPPGERRRSEGPLLAGHAVLVAV